MPVQEKILSPKQRVEVVTFRLGSQIYAFPLAPVRQIIEMVTVTSLPQVNPMIVGVINFHGVIVPVINMRHLLGLEALPYNLHTPIILMNISKRLIGLIVDNVLDVLERSSDQVVETNKILLEEMGETPLLKGLIQAQNGSILILDPEHLFKPIQKRALSEAIDTLTQSMEQRSVEEAENSQDSSISQDPEDRQSPQDSLAPQSSQDSPAPEGQESTAPVQNVEEAVVDEEPKAQPSKPARSRRRKKTAATAESTKKVSK